MRYRTIVADPPWAYASFRLNPGGRTDRHAPLPYPSMTVEEIQQLPVPALMDEDCLVWLWTTQRYLPRSFEVLAAWGADYRQTIVWHKPRSSPFCYPFAPQTAEFLLAAV